MLTVINGEKFLGTVPDANTPGFFGSSGRKTEMEYYRLLLASQNYFEQIAAGSITPTTHYYFSVDNNGCLETVDGYLLYVWNPIRVKPVSAGYLYCSNDGRHRYTVAQKYNLYLLVDVIENFSYSAQKKQHILQSIKNFIKFWL